MDQGTRSRARKSSAAIALCGLSIVCLYAHSAPSRFREVGYIVRDEFVVWWPKADVLSAEEAAHKASQLTGLMRCKCLKTLMAKRWESTALSVL